MISTLESPSTIQRPTRIRFLVVGMAILLGMVTYLDRACVGSLEKPIMRDLQLEEFELGYAQTAFAVAYGGFGILSAWWGDRVGTRIMLTAVVVAWSMFTMATGQAQGLASLVIIRFCFGAAESGAWPAIARTLSRWIPYRERGTAQGVVWIGAHITVGVTPLLIGEMTNHSITWRSIFFLFGLVGLFWAVAWFWWFRDAPSQHPQINRAELMYIEGDGKSLDASPIAREQPRGWAFWRRLLTHQNVVALCLMYLPNSFIFYFCITWFHRYLEVGRGMEGRELAFFTGLPLLMSVAGDLLGGTTTDWAVRRYGPRWGRAGVGFASYAVAGLCVLLAAFAQQAWLAATLFAVGNAANMFLMGSAWGTCQDIGGEHAGVVSATMNTAGQMGAMTCPLLVIHLKNQYGWNIDLVLIGVSFLAASFCWMFIDPRRKVFD
jgi:MFS transporter, ACS family, glucarate transporter